ncbi:pilus assembly protein [Agrobacterium tumefaciens]|uniref:Pilus assembly protein n=1 Tax=Agrobacterium tumefaciens TaxID=358 RepID=A0A0D0KSR9_AGRTU|nr:pilus assembly protein [Agrobacterium tumefaciens]
MTWSIVAREPETGHLGIAVATRFFAVGALVPHIRGKIGAIATQAFINPTYGTDGLTQLAEGKMPQEIIDALISRDEGSAQRQLHMTDAEGHNAAFTGQSCIDWAGQLVDHNVSVAGNMLAGPQVIEETMRVYKDTVGLPFAERLLLAIEAGEAAGGDKRGKQSAALVIYRDQDYPWLDIRTDDHADPLAELRRLYAVAQERYLYVAETMPTRANPHAMRDRAEIDDKIAAVEAARAAKGVPSSSFATPLKPA